MPLIVVSVAYPFAAVGPDAAGGAEQVLTMLDAAIVAAGHRSVVVARRGSVAAGTLVETDPPDGPIEGHAYWHGWRAAERGVTRAIREHAPDVVHYHGHDFFEYLPPPGVPALATLHLPASWYRPGAWSVERPGTFLHGVSASQHAGFPPAGAFAPGVILLPPIANGVAVDALPRPDVRRRTFALMLGRVCPEKNHAAGLDAARMAGVPVVLAGTVSDFGEHRDDYERRIVPRLGRHARYAGPAGLSAKRRLLSAARCLLVPSTVAETSSLVAMEALSCGTPVVAFRSGALPEVVEHGVTGFVVDDVRGMADAIGRVEAIDPGACRSTARARFDVGAMARRYLDLYARLANGVSSPSPSGGGTGGTPPG